MSAPLTADGFIALLQTHQSDAERTKILRYLKSAPPDNQAIGVRMKTLFDAAKASTAMPLDEVERLLESPFYEARVGAVSIMDFKTRRPRITDAERKTLFDLYLRRHDRINNWDLVDRSAPRVLGWYLDDKPRDPLYVLARSNNVWERRSATVATWWFTRTGDVDDVFAIGEMLVNDPEEYVNKALGVSLREAGEAEPARLREFLDRHVATMPRETLRYAIEKMPEAERKAYLKR